MIWKSLKAVRPDVLVSDIGMTYEDGYELMRKVRALPEGEGREGPAVALTAYARPEDRLKALRAGYQNACNQAHQSRRTCFYCRESRQLKRIN
ncbi:hypothetical protein BH18ACI4_BH18ACI4_22970 [soil metagenome]